MLLRSTGTDRRIARPLAAAAFVAMVVVGCATTQVTEQAANQRARQVDELRIDRLPRVNRAVYRFNRAVDKNVVRPIARGYDRFVPEPIDKGFRNFFHNLRAPLDIVNNWLQGKAVPGFADLGRFLLNSTAGIGGIFDPATKIGLVRHPEDFGQTFAVWGVPSGGFLMLPLLGAGTIRDWGAWGLDNQLDLLVEYDDSSVRDKLLLWRYLSDRAVLLPAEPTLEESFDEYVLVREAYLQNRLYEIRDGEIADEDYLYLEEDE